MSVQLWWFEMTRYQCSIDTSFMSFQLMLDEISRNFLSIHRLPPVHHQIILSIRSLRATNASPFVQSR